MKRMLIYMVALVLALTLAVAPAMIAGAAGTTEAVETAGGAETAEVMEAAGAAEAAEAVGVAEAAAAVQVSDYFTERDLSGEWDAAKAVAIELAGDTARCDSEGVTIEGNAVTIAQKGVYVLTGSLNGCVMVEAGDDDKVQLVLDGATIAAEGTAAIWVKNADKVFITLAEGSENAVTASGLTGEDGVDGAIFARDDIVFNGAGALIVDAPDGHGIVGKDDVKFASGSYVITASGRGIEANDSVRINAGSFDITAGKDGIRAKNEEDVDKGYVIIWDGEFRIVSGGGAQSAPGHSEGVRGFGRQASSADEGDSTSTKGIKASGDLTILGGSFDIDSADDALHTDADMTVFGGSLTISSGDDGMHANGALTIAGGTVDIIRSYEGIEGTSIDISGGDIRVAASDDGLNAAGGSDGSGYGYHDMFASQEGVSISISGGTLYVNASGDGIDSNGSLSVSGGTIVVSGPTNSGNGALDYNGSGIITGGTVIAAGASGMAENFSSGSTQPAAMVSLSGQAGTITVADAQGNVILSGAVEKSYDCVVISAPELAVGQSYTVSNGSASVEVTQTETIVGSGMGGFGGHGGMRGGRNGMDNRSGGMPGMNGEMPEMGNMPEMNGEAPEMGGMPGMNGAMPEMPGGMGGMNGSHRGGKGGPRGDMAGQNGQDADANDPGNGN